MNLFPTAELMTEYRFVLSAKKKKNCPIDFRNVQARNNAESFHRSSVTKRFVSQIDRGGQGCFVILYRYTERLEIDTMRKLSLDIDVYHLSHSKPVDINDSLSRGNDRPKDRIVALEYRHNKTKRKRNCADRRLTIVDYVGLLSRIRL